MDSSYVVGLLSFLTGCLLVPLGESWTIDMPGFVTAVEGSCVEVPCHTEAHQRVIWYRYHGVNYPVVYNGQQPTSVEYQFQGRTSVPGDATKGDCTLRIDNVRREDNQVQVYVWINPDESQSQKFYHQVVTINVVDSPSPTLTPASVEVKEGDPVSLSCSAAVLCPSLPPTLTWTPRLGDSEENLQENQTNLVTSVLTFNASSLHHGQTVSCTALYRRQDGNNGLSAETTLTISVLYLPRNTSVSVSPSGPVLEGSSVTLTCSSDANPPVSFTWYRVSGEMNRETVGSEQRLTFNKAATENNGQYMCEVLNGYGQDQSTVTLINIQYPPKNTSVSVSPSGPVLEGSSVTLTCSSDANPAVENYTWYRVDGDQVISEKTTKILTTIISKDRSQFYCEASNLHGVEKSAVFKWDVLYPPKNTSVSVSPSGPVLEGSSVTLTCSSDANPEVENYTWYRVDGDQVKSSGFGKALTTTVFKDKRQFYCEARNVHGAQKSEILKLNILYPPKSVRMSVSPSGPVLEGSSVTLTCSSDANPAVENYTWYRVDGDRVTSGFGKALTTTVFKEKRQFYCEARNVYGTENSTVFQLDILYPPRNTSVSLSPSVLEGSSVTLTCSSDANPAVETYTWYRVDGDQVISERSTKIFSTIVSKNRSQFYCEASNVHGVEKSAVFKLDILYPPKNTSVSVSPSGPVLEGSSVTLTCSSDANPAVESYTWYRVDGDQVTSGFGRMLTTKVFKDKSQFYCEARNVHGAEKSEVFKLNILYPPKSVMMSVSHSGSVLEGSSVTLTCSSDANPAVENYTWYRVDGDRVKSSGFGTTLITTVFKDNSPIFCEARNVHGTENSTVFKLDVLYPPTNTSVSVSPSGPVLEGSSVTLTCSSDANPAVENYTWYRVKETEELAVRSGPNITFNRIYRDDAGQYLCVAQNRHGIDKTGTVNMDVTYAPEILSSSHCVRATAQIKCSCESHGNPSPRLEWRLAGQPVNHSDTVVWEEPLGSKGLRSSFTMHHSLEDTPTVVCISTNSVRSTGFQFGFQVYVDRVITEQQQDHNGDFQGYVPLPVFFTAVVVSVLLTGLICALLFSQRGKEVCFRMTRCQAKSSSSDDAVDLVLTSGGRAEEAAAPEDDVYVNSEQLSQAKRDEVEEGREDSAQSNQEVSLEMKNLYKDIGPKADVDKPVDCEYAQV